MAMRLREDYRGLNGPEKAAIFMLAVGEEHTSRLFEHMTDEEIMEVSQTMANLGKISSDVVEKLFKDFADSMSSTGSLVGSYESTERLLSNVLGQDKVSQIMEEIRGPAGRTMWDKLGNVNEETLAGFLKNEYPQTVAVVLSKVEPPHTAKVLAQLPQNFAMEVVERMLKMEAVQKEVLEDVERTLREEFMSTLSRTSRQDSHELMADILNSMERSKETAFLEALEDRDEEAAEKIRNLMFTFEDLLKLEDSGIQTLLREVDRDQLPIALKGAGDDIKDLFFKNMSERAVKILQEDMQTMGPVRLRDVEESQQHIINAAKDLADKGEIIIIDSSSDEEYIY